MENLEMTDEEKEHIKKGESLASLYCKGCRECVEQCTKALPVPDAHQLLVSLDVSENPCADCRECTVNCTSGFNVAEKIKNVSRLVNVPEDFIT